MLIVTAPDTGRHDPPYEIDLGWTISPPPERAARYEAIESAVAAAGFETTSAQLHPDGLWRGVHDPELVDWLRDGWRDWREAGGPEVLIPDTFAHRAWPGRRPTSPIGIAGWWLTDTATPIVEGSYAAARAAVDAALTAVDLVVGEGHRAVHALTRPPGHHAGPAYLGGFCLVNHAAIAASALRDALGRVAIVDIDFHHGNGTQEVFWEDARVLYTSLHADPTVAYPWFTGHREEIGAGEGEGTNLNVPLPRDTGDDAYLGALWGALDTVAAFGADAVVLSLGTDTAATDPVGGLQLTPDAFSRIGSAIAELDLPVVSVQEGGYDLASVGRDTVAVLTTLG